MQLGKLGNILPVDGGNKGAMKLGNDAVGDVVPVVFQLGELPYLFLHILPIPQQLGKETGSPHQVLGALLKEVEELFLAWQEMESVQRLSPLYQLKLAERSRIVNTILFKPAI
jgi:hypothetical protein